MGFTYDAIKASYVTHNCLHSEIIFVDRTNVSSRIPEFNALSIISDERSDAIIHRFGRRMETIKLL